MSLVQVTEEIKEAYKTISSSGNQTNKGMILALDDKNNLQIEKTFPKQDFSLEEFTKAFPEKEGRYGVLEYSYSPEEGRFDSKILFILWAPTLAHPLKKMKYSTGFASVQNEIGSATIGLQADNYNDLSEEHIRSKLK